MMRARPSKPKNGSSNTNVQGLVSFEQFIFFSADAKQKDI